MITDKELKEISSGLEKIADAVMDLDNGNKYAPIHIRDYLLYFVSVLNGTVDAGNKKRIESILKND